MRQDFLKAARKRDGYHQDILSRPDLDEEIKQLKPVLHIPNIKRQVIQDRLQLQLASAQKDLAFATARLGVSDQSQTDLRRHSAVIAEITKKVSIQKKELTQYQKLVGCLEIERDRAISDRDAIRDSVARLTS